MICRKNIKTYNHNCNEYKLLKYAVLESKIFVWFFVPIGSRDYSFKWLTKLKLGYNDLAKAHIFFEVGSK